MTAVPDGFTEACPPDRPDFDAIVDHDLVGQLPENGACGRLTGQERRLLLPVWGGDSEEPSLVARARVICLSCPALQACRRYGTENLDEQAFLAGMTATERRTTWTRRDRVAWRRRKVRLLHAAGATVAEMSEVLATPRRTIEADITALGLNGSRRRV